MIINKFKIIFKSFVKIISNFFQDDFYVCPKQEIRDWLDHNQIAKYIILDDLTINVDGDVFLNDKELTCLPYQFNIVKGHFFCFKNKLKSLKGCPYRVGGIFDCHSNILESLQYAPLSTLGGMDCSDNNLNTLLGCPEEILADFNCSHNKLTSLKYCPFFIGGSFNCENNLLEKLDYGPISVGKSIHLSNNLITNFQFFPQYVGEDAWLINNPIAFIPQVNHLGRNMIFNQNKKTIIIHASEIKKHILYQKLNQQINSNKKNLQNSKGKI